ncbi:uncharacterized protein LOC129319231 [Prosopis cineraria]|uniref:uncharacterized protein LOC129319231 n=1 Tax=Prosopis cineraria TaxID=364024 RepID=UPI00240FE5ED|nr:uncharacterized protein LOC129319231 [Prosopis cineraria]
MGGCVSSCRSSSSSSTTAFKNVRVVHLNGYVEDFLEPVSVRQLTGDPPKHFVCTTLQLLSPSNSTTPLKADAKLRPGEVYFKLPCSVLQADVSPVDLASLAKRLTAIAKTTSTIVNRAEEDENQPRLGRVPLSSHLALSHRDRVSVSACGLQGGRRRGGGKRSLYGHGVQPWKPILDPIGESSFGSRCSE